MQEGTRQGLFRPEVLESAQGRTHGPILLARTGSSWMFVALAALIAASAVTYLFVGVYKPRTVASGFLVPESGAIRVQAPAAAVVIERRVREGQAVRKGDVLFVLADERRHLEQEGATRFSDLRAGSFRERKGSLVRQREAAQQLAQQADLGYRAQHLNLADELRRNLDEIELQKRRVESSNRALDKHRGLARENYISDMALQAKEDETAAQQSQLLSLQRVRAQLQRASATLKSEWEQLPMRTTSQVAEIDRDIALLSQEITDVQARDGYAVTAPMDGVVTAVNAELGQSVSTQALAVVLPKDVPLVAHLFAASRAFGFVHAGQKVRLRYEPYPYQRFGLHTGTVVEVANSPMRADELALVPAALTGKEAVYRVVVRLDKEAIQVDGQTVGLRPGTALEADIEQEERRLMDWILEPLRTASAKL